jgi:hypothetical protein
MIFFLATLPPLKRLLEVLLSAVEQGIPIADSGEQVLGSAKLKTCKDQMQKVMIMQIEETPATPGRPTQTMKTLMTVNHVC